MLIPCPRFGPARQGLCLKGLALIIEFIKRAVRRLRARAMPDLTVAAKRVRSSQVGFSWPHAVAIAERALGEVAASVTVAFLAVHGLVLRTQLRLVRYPRRVMAGLAALLLGTGVTAFGVAPVSSPSIAAPNVELLPVVSLSEPLALLPQTAAFDPDSAQPFVLYRSDTVRRNDTPQALLKRLGSVDAGLLAFLRNDPTAKKLLGREAVGSVVHSEVVPGQGVQRLRALWASSGKSGFQRLVLEKQADVWVSRVEQGALQRSMRMGSGEIRSSLFAATDAAQIPDAVASQMAEMFAEEIDFRRDLRVGDRFSVVYEAFEVEGELLQLGRILSARFVNNAQVHEAVWFDSGEQAGAYFGFDGTSQRKSFMGSPLEFSRVSSGYGMRFHPISGQRKAHLGVDYVAPTGTPVRTVADGVVQFAGVQRGYGNVIYIGHAKQQTTVYAHLSRIDVRQGERVQQGQLVGAVGSTGASTGPHLHFEFRENGQHQDPLAIARQNENVSVDARLRPRFDALAQEQRQHLEAAALVRQASAE